MAQDNTPKLNPTATQPNQSITVIPATVDKKQKRKDFLKKFIPIFVGSITGVGMIAGITCSVVQCSTYNEIFTKIGTTDSIANCVDISNNIEAGVSYQSILFSKQPDDNKISITLKQEVSASNPELCFYKITKDEKTKETKSVEPIDSKTLELTNVSDKVASLYIGFKDRQNLINSLASGQSAISNYTLDMVCKSKGKEFKQTIKGYTGTEKETDITLKMTYRNNIIEDISETKVGPEGSKIGQSKLNYKLDGSKHTYNSTDLTDFVIDTSYGYITNPITKEEEKESVKTGKIITSDGNAYISAEADNFSNIKLAIKQITEGENKKYVMVVENSESTTQLAPGSSIDFKITITPTDKPEAKKYWKEYSFTHQFIIK